MLTYADLRTPGGPLDRREPQRELELHLTGNMERFMWSRDGRLQVRKHTVSVQPAQRVSFAVSADAPGRWSFHCHLLYHMAAGMFREVVVDEHARDELAVDRAAWRVAPRHRAGFRRGAGYERAGAPARCDAGGDGRACHGRQQRGAGRRRIHGHGFHAGRRAPAAARDPNAWADGYEYTGMPGFEQTDKLAFGKMLLDEFELVSGNEGEGGHGPFRPPMVAIRTSCGCAARG